jgi:hypothetical protein
MIDFFDWFPPAAVGVTFTTLGVLKVWGWRRGIVGGEGKPAACRLLGRCPGWSRQLNILFIIVLFCIGLFSLGLLLRLMLR